MFSTIRNNYNKWYFLVFYDFFIIKKFEKYFQIVWNITFTIRVPH